jgi:peptidoglycan/LPS O-acetylase OafA/YrhL
MTAAPGIRADSVAHIAAIDGLRALAILPVLVYHLDADLLPGGFLGVDVFFVISGFVVTMSMSRVADRGLTAFAAEFYRRRILRVLPALILCVLVVMIASVLLLPVPPFGRSSEAVGLLALLGLGNLGIWYLTGDYFSPQAAFNPFTHTWSLGVEEQFYLFFPLVIHSCLRSHSRRTAAILLPLFALSLGAAALLTSRDPGFAYYMLPARLWELLAGVLLYLWHSQRILTGGVPTPNRPLNTALAAGALALMAWSFLAAHPDGTPFPWAVPIVLATSALIARVTEGSGGSIGRALSSVPLAYLGRISYGLYLWHFAVIVLMRWTVGIDTAAGKVTAAIVSVLLAALSDACVERPIRFGRAIAAQTNRTVIVRGAGATVLAVVIGVGLFIARPQVSRTVTTDEAVWSFRADDRFSEGPCTVTRIADTRGELGETRFVPVGCGTQSSTSRQLLVLGDSHAVAYEPMLQRVAAAEGVHVAVIQQPGCAWVTWYRRRDEVEPKGCPAFHLAAVAHARGVLTRGDIVFLPGLRIPRYRDSWGSTMLETDDSEYRVMPEDAREVDRVFADFTRLLENGIHVIVEAPKPVFRTAPFRCADWFTRRNPYCAAGTEVSRAELERRRGRVVAALIRLSSLSSSITVWDPLPPLCPGEVCSAFRDGVPLFNDGDHLSGYGNRVLLPHFLAHLHGMESRPD